MKIEDPTRFMSLMRGDGGVVLDLIADEMEGMGLVIIATDLVPLTAVWSWWFFRFGFDGGGGGGGGVVVESGGLLVELWWSLVEKMVICRW
ncbi:hypothetical protein Ddye_025915 [Dipteronia dyeriana]|uniref:Uncharacterized protein n=1 Tax=Dipteronia dyeriana TaxID=168575 RepID=A0AAD9TL63_9ROSI|nr:hypothetical protein Ddye_025915 [Dipteronia dyeriana]